MVSADWRPSATRDILARRAGLLCAIRTFMHDRGVLEVETPALSHAAATDPNIQSLQSRVHLPQASAAAEVCLHTSPEFPMKRLLAAGLGPIFQVAKVFRDHECGPLHQPEFTMLEWYRPGFDHHRLMDEIAELLQMLGLPAPARSTYRDVFMRHTGLCPHTAPDEALQNRAAELGLVASGADRNLLLDFLFSRTVTPRLPASGALVYAYPVSQAALARIVPSLPPVAERFELFLSGMEIANGFHELGDSVEQRRRFAADNARRASRGLPVMPVDERLLAALDSGLPDCAGAALGVERLLMVLTGSKRIDEVVAFPFARS
ncbi:MAG: EF-P lysine aminoacylase GenX [Gammaproteobacteria bacterium]|nr:EF-P lysine aminoacylase GenX [Gammaproteobacteria bacterium]